MVIINSDTMPNATNGIFIAGRGTIDSSGNALINIKGGNYTNNILCLFVNSISGNFSDSFVVSFSDLLFFYSPTDNYTQVGFIATDVNGNAIAQGTAFCYFGIITPDAVQLNNSNTSDVGYPKL